MIWPQYLYLLAGIIAIVHGLFFMPQVELAARLTNILILLFFMYMVSGIVQASWYGVKFSVPSYRLLAVGTRRRLAVAFTARRGVVHIPDVAQAQASTDQPVLTEFLAAGQKSAE
jgi:hypothetical protein